MRITVVYGVTMRCQEDETLHHEALNHTWMKLVCFRRHPLPPRSRVTEQAVLNELQQDKHVLRLGLLLYKHATKLRKLSRALRTQEIYSPHRAIALCLELNAAVSLLHRSAAPATTWVSSYRPSQHRNSIENLPACGYRCEPSRFLHWT
jgi:hypothetical protein